MTNWYVAKSKPQKESWLVTNLTSLGVEVFYPRIVSKRRGKRIEEPLFPTYVFCRFEVNAPKWPIIRWSPGLNYFLGTDGRPSPVPEELIDYIRERVAWWNSEGFDQKTFQPGQRVMVKHGPFAGLEGIFQRHVSSRQRCYVLLQVVGGLSPVEIAEADLVDALPRALNSVPKISPSISVN